MNGLKVFPSNTHSGLLRLHPAFLTFNSLFEEFLLKLSLDAMKIIGRDHEFATKFDGELLVFMN